MTGPLVIPLPWERPPLSLNDRLHWRVLWRRRQDAKEDVRWAIRSVRRRSFAGAEVELVWRVPDMRVRDLDNPVATLKPCLDALVAEGVIPADDWRIVRRASVRIEPPSDRPGPSVWLEVIEATPIRLPATRPPKKKAGHD